MRNTFTIRLATPEDAASINDVHKASIDSLCADHYSAEQRLAWHPEDRTQKIKASIQDDIEVMFVAELDDKIVGFSSVVPSGNELRAVYVHSSVARTGVGRALAIVLEEEANKHGCAFLELDSSVNAAPFYKYCGYTELERSKHQLDGGVEIECIKMRKEL